MAATSRARVSFDGENLVAPAATLPLFGTIDEFSRMFGISRRATYEEIAAGHLKAVKRGTRTMVDFHHALKYFQSLPSVGPEPEQLKRGRGRPRKTAAPADTLAAAS
jgi:hypothetical protein